MLELRPSCEHCDKNLAPDSDQAMICSFECTFCLDCVVQVLQHACPNCGGAFSPRPIRPAIGGKNQNDLQHYPASTVRKYRPIDRQAHAAWLASRNQQA